MRKIFILSVILAGSVSAPLLSDNDGMAAVSTDAYPAQILVAPSTNINASKLVWNTPDQLLLKPGEYMFWTSPPQSGLSCRQEATLKPDKTYNIVLTNPLNEGVCSIEVNEIN